MASTLCPYQVTWPALNRPSDLPSQAPQEQAVEAGEGHDGHGEWVLGQVVAIWEEREDQALLLEETGDLIDLWQANTQSSTPVMHNKESSVVMWNLPKHPLGMEFIKLFSSIFFYTLFMCT